jgi:hypothetical protein
MPFSPRDLATVPDAMPNVTPDVEIFFSGQLLLRSEDGASCEVAVNQLATNHVLTIEARTRAVGKPVEVRMRHVGPLNFRQGAGMSIEIHASEGSPTPTPAAWNCRTLHTVHYDTGVNPPPDADFRWILNLEGPFFHAKELHPAIFNSHHVIRLQGGEYFFRTAARASDRFDYKRIKVVDGGEATFRKIGAVARASVFLTEEQSLVLQWQGPVAERDHTVTLLKTQNTTHEIYINNSPLFLDPPEDKNETLAQFDELIEYYKLISQSEVAATERFKLFPVIPDPPRGGEEGSPDIPCQVMRLDGPTDV